jgi:proline dehydrogenase
MIDAEHTYFQPAIDNTTTDLEKKFNKKHPVVFSTYQMYLKDSSKRLEIDKER